MHYADRVQETTTTTGTGTVTLGGAVTGYRAFTSAFSSGDTVRYAITDGTAWEVGEGIFTTSGTTLTRATVFASSNSNALVSFAAGTKSVWCDVPAAALVNLGAASSKAALYRDASGNVGTSAVVTIDESAQELDITCADQSTVFRAKNYSSSTLGSNLMLNQARGTLASPTKTLSGDQLGGISGRGWHQDGTPGFGPSTANSARFEAEEDFTASTMGSAFVLALSKIGGTAAAEVMRVSGHGFMTVTCKTASTGSIGVAKWTAAAHTAQTASTELNDFLFDSSATLQFAAGALTTQRQFLVKARTYSFASSSTITTAATFVIDKAPVAGTNATITTAYALWVQAGKAQFDGGAAGTFYAASAAGTAAATTGTIRLGGTALLSQVTWNDGSGDRDLIRTYGAGARILFGEDTYPCEYRGSTVSLMQSTGANALVVGSGLISSSLPIVGDSGAPTPNGAVDGQATIAVSTAGITLSAAQYSRKIQKFTGSPAATRTITYPHPADEDHSYVRHLIGAHTVSALTISTGTGTTASLAVGVNHTYSFTPDGVRLFT